MGDFSFLNTDEKGTAVDGEADYEVDTGYATSTATGSSRRDTAKVVNATLLTGHVGSMPPLSSIQGIQQALAEAVDRAFLAGLAPEPAVTEVGQIACDTQGVDVAAFIKTVRKLREDMPPFVTEIWFVDCPGDYARFAGEFPEVSLWKKGPLPVSRIDVIQWETRFFDPETEVIAESDDDVRDMLKRGRMEKIIWPWICREPGVWLHWSNGRYQKFLPGE
ncbi:MAG: hypothetical protein H6659_18620 [Ardenticatenaceae bacterium]|nr:hypothetical protein [Ardenticatenaceae bacterium]